MNMFTRSLLATMVVAGAGNAFAAQNATLNITAKTTPLACDITLTATAAFGDLDMVELGTARTSGTALHSLSKIVTVPMAIKCPAPMALSVSSAPAGGVVNTSGKLPDDLGEYTLTLKNPTGDGGTVQTLVGPSDGSNWSVEGVMPVGATSVLSFGEGGAPKAYTDFEADIDVSLKLNPKKVDLLNGQDINTSTVISLDYL